MTNTRFDTNYQVETPESIDLHAQIAGPVPRMLAYAIDLVIRAIIIIFLWIITLFIGDVGTGLFLIAWFLLEWFYPVLFEVYRDGQTPGKKSMGISVINDNLTPIGWSSSLTRNLLRAADFLPSFYVGGLICMVSNQRFQRLGDIAAGSLVIHKDRDESNLTLPKTTPRPSPIPLDIEDQIAIIGFTQRHQQLSQDRQQELADILKDVTRTPQKNAIDYLQGIGCWLLGDRK